MEVKFLLLLAACLIGAAAQLTTSICSQVCRNPRQVLCPGPATAADCKEGQIFKKNGSFCSCCNACYTHVGANRSCLAVPSRGIYYQCPEGYICSYREYCEKE
ncbi:uncharacterized protein LOC111871499 [Cryptotermes secundus]|uniref:uncharacterized protein LOC111871499 n=1 Tax=Cryptotermes secundus TaxID=105785 RepID=UPI000CD7C20C|nr:uncharacterized protein LOC111871499 [Cryptotermes secundus]